jgi:subtilisin family serine protease
MFALRDDRAYAALNLSLGTFGAIVGGEELPPVYLRQALDEWDTAGAPVLAAAGNSVVEGKAAFYPAAFEDVYGVAAIDLESTYTVWSGYGRNTRTTQDLPAWVYTRAPGVDLVSVVPAESPFVRWSGSSFATAVATGVTALCDLDQPPGELGYDEVPGLWSAEDPASPVLSAGSLECGGLR